MTVPQQKVLPVVTLRYRKGDLIIKEGDFGISIYKIIQGKVFVFRECGDTEIALSTLTPGEIFGEISFLSKAGETRSASVRALEETELEVWHPSILTQEYEKMPLMLKYVVDQLLGRLLRMTQLLVQMSDQEKKRRNAAEKQDPFVSERRYYRKTVDLECGYRPVGLSEKVRLPGRIKDIGINGLRVEIAAQNTTRYSHMEGELFAMNIDLPNGKVLEFEARIVSLKQSESAGKLVMGLSITELSDNARKLLGFFLMP